MEKQDAETGSVVAGAVFGLYNKNEIKSGDNVIVKADTLLQEITSDEKGQAHFTLDLPLGTYYVKKFLHRTVLYPLMRYWNLMPPIRDKTSRPLN